MPALWTAWRLICESPQPLKFIFRDIVRHGLEGAGVERTGNAITAISTTIKIRLKVHSRNRPIVLDSGLDFHQHGMAAAMAIKHFFSGESDLYWSARDHRQLANNYLVIEWIAFSSKTATIWRSYDANMTRSKAEHFGERTMDIMWRLRRTPQSYLFV